MLKKVMKTRTRMMMKKATNSSSCPSFSLFLALDAKGGVKLLSIYLSSFCNKIRVMWT